MNRGTIANLNNNTNKTNKTETIDKQGDINENRKRNRLGFFDKTSNINVIQQLTKEDIDLVFGLMRLKIDRMEFQGEPTKSELQLDFLQSVAKITSFPSTETKYDMSYILQMQYKSVSIWFQNNRQRKKGKQRTEIIDDNYHISREQLYYIYQNCYQKRHSRR